MTLTEFILQRVAEDEMAAKGAGADAMLGWRWKAWPKDAYDEIQATVIANSKRVLAECEAKRRIVEAHRAWDENEWQSPPYFSAPMDEVLALLALPYADHHQFEEEWRV